MRTMDFTKYKFRASGVGKLMTPTRGKSNFDKLQDLIIKRDDYQAKHDALRDGLKRKQNYADSIHKLNQEISELEEIKDVIELSSTAKTYLEEIFIEETYGRSKEITSKFTEKGHYAEEDSITLVTEQRDILFTKNEKRFENDFVAGTPDIIIEEKLIIDIKTKWDIWGFMSENGSNSDYFWQLQTYMWLTGIDRAELIYTLVNTPQHLIYQEFTRARYQQLIEEGSEEEVELEMKIEKNMTYDDIDPASRIKVYQFTYNPENARLMERYIKSAREYLNSLSLN